MALKGHVFNKQLFTSECFALFIDTFLAGNNGIVTGCEMSNTTNSINIHDGYFCIKGRFIEEEGGTTINVEGTTQDDIYCKLVCEIDLSKENTVTELKQVSYKVLQATNDYPVLQQENITVTGGGNIYQFELAQFKVTETGIENFVDKRTFLDFNSIYEEIRRNINTFLSEQNITTKEQINSLIADLKTYCDTAKEVLTDDIVMNLLNLINTKADSIKAYKLNIETKDWIKKGDYYECNVVDSTITKNHSIEMRMNLENQAKMTDGSIESYDGGYRIITSVLPTQTINSTILVQKINSVSNQIDEQEYELITKEYNENEKYFLETEDGEQRTIVNMTNDNTVSNVLIIEEVNYV